jgi:hypothetical protein
MIHADSLLKVVRRHRRLIPTNSKNEERSDIYRSNNGYAEDYDPQQQDRYTTTLQSGWLGFEGHVFFFKYSRDPVVQDLPPTSSSRNHTSTSGRVSQESITFYAVHWVSASALGKFMSELTKPKQDDRIRYTDIHTLVSGRNR